MFSQWSAPNLCFITEYTPKLFKEHVQEAGKIGSSALDCFAHLEYFLLRSHRALNQPWTLGLATLRRCIQQRDFPFACLSVVLEEIVQSLERY